MNVWKALVLGASVGFVFSLASGCPGKTCSPANCSGCCDSSNNCIPVNGATATGQTQSANSCGVLGNACKPCQSGQTCTNGACTGSSGNCNPTNCPHGCCSSIGTCLAGSTAQSAANCGSGGATCQPCNGGSCTINSVTGDGTCSGGGPDAGASGGVGDPCSVDSDCTNLIMTKGSDAGVVCLQTTPDGGGIYTGGYCTLLNCTIPANSCPGSAKCKNLSLPLQSGFPFMDFYGETRTMCIESCVSDWDCTCRKGSWVASANGPTCTGTMSPDYTCFLGNNWKCVANCGTSNAQYDFDPTAPGFGCFLNEPANPGQTGLACNGSDFTTAGWKVCGLPPTNGFCGEAKLPDGGFSTASCTADCLSAFTDSQNGADYWCGDGGICIGFGLNNAKGIPLLAQCEQRCDAPNGGVSNCAAPGNVCWGGITTNGQPATFGICQQDCFQFGGDAYCQKYYCPGQAGCVCMPDAGTCCGATKTPCLQNSDCCSGTCSTGACL